MVGSGGRASAQYPPSDDAGTVDKSVVESGGSVKFCGFHFVFDSEVVVRDTGVFVATVRAEESGSSLSGHFCITLALTEAGLHVLTGTGMGGIGDDPQIPTGPRTAAWRAVPPHPERTARRWPACSRPKA